MPAHRSPEIPRAGYGAAAQKFIASTQIPERQIEVFKIMGNGCANPAASAMLPPELARNDPGRAENLKQQIIIDQ